MTGPAARRLRAARPPAALLMGVGAVGVASGALTWADPLSASGGNFVAPARVRQAVADGRRYEVVQPEAQPGYTGSTHVSERPAKAPVGPAVRAVYVACAEAVLLLLAVRTAGVLFALAGAVYCLGRPHPEDEA